MLQCLPVLGHAGGKALRADRTNSNRPSSVRSLGLGLPATESRLFPCVGELVPLLDPCSCPLHLSFSPGSPCPCLGQEVSGAVPSLAAPGPLRYTQPSHWSELSRPGSPRQREAVSSVTSPVDNSRGWDRSWVGPCAPEISPCIREGRRRGSEAPRAGGSSILFPGWPQLPPSVCLSVPSG